MSFNENPVVRYIYQLQGATNSIPMKRLAAPDLRMLLEMSDEELAREVAGKRPPMYSDRPDGAPEYPYPSAMATNPETDLNVFEEDESGGSASAAGKMELFASAQAPGVSSDDDDVMAYDEDAVKASAPGGADWTAQFEKFRNTPIEALEYRLREGTPDWTPFAEPALPAVRPPRARPGSLEEGAPYLGYDNRPLIVARDGTPILFNREGTPLPYGPDGKLLPLTPDGTPIAYDADDITTTFSGGDPPRAISISPVYDAVDETIYLAKRKRMRSIRTMTRKEDRLDEKVEENIGAAERARLQAEIIAMTTAAARKALMPPTAAAPRTLESVMTPSESGPKHGGIFSAELITAQEAAMQKVHAMVRGPVRKVPTVWHFILANDDDVVSLFAQLVARHVGRADNLNPKQVRLAATYTLNEEHLAGILDQLNAYDFHVDDNSMPVFTPFAREDVWDRPGPRFGNFNPVFRSGPAYNRS